MISIVNLLKFSVEFQRMAFNILSSMVKQLSISKSLTCAPVTFNMTSSLSTTPALERSRRVWRKPHPVPEKVGINPYKHKSPQEWWDWDGFGPYKYRHHHYPNNITCRDVQRRRIFKQTHEERRMLNSVMRSEILPRELREKAWREKHFNLPLDSSHRRPVFRCAVTGRARGNYPEFRVSRFIFRAEADYNKVSGVQRAFWLYNTHINP